VLVITFNLKSCYFVLYREGDDYKEISVPAGRTYEVCFQMVNFIMKSLCNKLFTLLVKNNLRNSNLEKLNIYNPSSFSRLRRIGVR
jgi:hypothetical protein